MFVQFNAENGWDFQKTHVNISADAIIVDGVTYDPSDGRPAPGQYTIQTTHDPRVTTYTYAFALADYPGSEIYILTHAEAISSNGGGETAYGGDLENTGNGWWYYSVYSEGDGCGSGGGNDDGDDDDDGDGPTDPDPTYALSGTVFFDENANASFGNGEATLEGITVELYDASGNLVATTSTLSDGSYAFDELLAGIYTVVVDPEGTLDGLASTTGESLSVSIVDVDASDVDFGYQLPTVDGTVYFDRDENGMDDSEPAIAGATVVLIDSNGNTVATTTTDADGNYSFDVLPGDYTVEVQNPGTLTSTTGESTNVSVGFGDVSNIDFGYALPVISGSVFWDEDSNGMFDGGELNFDDTAIEVQLLDASGNVVATTTIAVDGSYEFEVLPGDYTVVVDPAGLLDGLTSTTGESLSVSVGYGDETGLDFGYELPEINGTVFFDITENGLQDVDESGLEGVMVTLEDGSGNVVATTTTDADGNYSFDVYPGDYSVVVDPVDGLFPTTSTDVAVVVGYADETVDFGYALNLDSFCGVNADGFTIGFWKNNLSKAIAGKKKGVQVDAITLEDYTAFLSDFSLDALNPMEMQDAVDFLRDNSSDAVDLLEKQLMGSEYNYANGAYIGGNEFLTELFVYYGEYLVQHNADYSRDELLEAKDWFDAYNNSHGGAIAGPTCQ